MNNSHVVPKPDRKDRSASWRALFGFIGAVTLLIVVLLPSAYSLTSGYRLQELKKKRDTLRSESALLDVEIARRTAPGSLEAYAKGRLAPGNKKIVFIQPEGSVALKAGE